MAQKPNILLQATAKNTVLMFSCPGVLTVPVIITGTGIEDMLALEDIEGAMLERGTDGTLSAHVLPNAIVKGTLTLQPLSTALNAFINVMKIQDTTGVIAPGSLSVANPSGVWEVAYENVVITTQYKGFELATKVKDVPIKFSAQIPSSTILGDAISVVTAAVNLI